MNKNLYVYLTLFLGLSLACGLVNSIAWLQMGADMYTLDYFIAWLIAASLTNALASVLLLKYYYYHNHRFAFVTLLIAVIANVGMFVIAGVIFTSGNLRNYYPPALLFSLTTGIVYGAGLVFSNTRQKPWLRLAGAYFFALCVIMLTVFVVNTNVQNTRANIVLQNIGQWASMGISLAPAFYIINFLKEIEILNTAGANLPKQKLLENIYGFAATVALMATLTLGTLLIKDGYIKSYWANFGAGQAQQLVKLAGGERTFNDSKGISLHYILIKPQNYDQRKKYPLVVCLPYVGYQSPPADVLAFGASRVSYPAFIFVPYCPDGQGWGGMPGVPSLDFSVYETISALTDPAIDVKRRYVAGVSRGGYGTWQFICTRPGMFAAAMPVCGGGDPKLASKVVNMPIWAFHGAKDKNVPVSGSRDMIAAIRKAGGHPEYTEYPNESHNIWDQVSNTPGVWNWLFAQKQK